MIPISSQSPTLPSHNSLNYELLSLTAICGEVPCACSSHLTASESYRKKVVTSLTHDKLLRIFSRQHLRGYRLGVRGKRLLLQQEPARFEFYLSGCSDTNAIKSEVSRRIRLHRIAQTYVTMLNAGALIYRDEKPPIFSPSARGPFCIEQPCFYDSREMKEAARLLQFEHAAFLRDEIEKLQRGEDPTADTSTRRAAEKQRKTGKGRRSYKK